MISQINEIFNTLALSIPNPKTELFYTNNFTLLVAVALSAQNTDIQVNKVTDKLFQTISHPTDIIQISLEDLQDRIKTLNYYKTKAKNVILMSKMLLEEFNGQVPNNFNDLIKLPGVGSKTANVVLNCAFGESVIAVDTHVHRVSNRLGIVKTKKPEETEIKLNVIVPEALRTTAHNLLVLHGRYVCRAKKPSCLDCNINKFCKYYENTSV